MSQAHSLARPAAVLGAVLAALSFAACSPTAAPTIPTLRSAGTAPTATISPEQAMRSYVVCLRGKGIAMPDPKVQADGSVDLVYPDVVDKGAFITADEGCRDLLVNAYPPSTPNPNAAQEQDQLLAYARCMREHGIDMPDPASGPQSTTVSAIVGPEEANPSFIAADRACSYLLPGKPGSSPSGSPAPSATASESAR